MYSELFAVINTEGCLKTQDVLHECKKDRWIPLFVYEKPKITVPIFLDQKIAYEFAKRNLPKGQSLGAVNLIRDNLLWIQDQGYEVEVMNFPKLVKNRGISMRVMEFDCEPETYGVHIG